MGNVAQKKNVCSQEDVDVAVGRYLRVSISIEQYEEPVRVSPVSSIIINMGPQVVLPTFESATVSSLPTKSPRSVRMGSKYLHMYGRAW